MFGIDPHSLQIDDLWSIRHDFGLEQQLGILDPYHRLTPRDSAGAALVETLRVFVEGIDAAFVEGRLGVHWNDQLQIIGRGEAQTWNWVARLGGPPLLTQ